MIGLSKSWKTKTLETTMRAGQEERGKQCCNWKSERHACFRGLILAIFPPLVLLSADLCDYHDYFFVCVSNSSASIILRQSEIVLNVGMLFDLRAPGTNHEYGLQRVAR